MGRFVLSRLYGLIVYLEPDCTLALYPVVLILMPSLIVSCVSKPVSYLTIRFTMCIPISISLKRRYQLRRLCQYISPMIKVFLDGKWHICEERLGLSFVLLLLFGWLICWLVVLFVLFLCLFVCLFYLVFVWFIFFCKDLAFVFVCLKIPFKLLRVFCSHPVPLGQISKKEGLGNR